MNKDPRDIWRENIRRINDATPRNCACGNPPHPYTHPNDAKDSLEIRLPDGTRVRLINPQIAACARCTDNRFILYTHPDYASKVFVLCARCGGTVVLDLDLNPSAKPRSQP